MDANRINILNESNRVLGKLQLLAVYFGEELIYKIYVRSQVIHKMFETNPELDINKLELFHLQFTASLTDLLKKIKKSNENNVSLLYDEVQLNKDMIARLGDTLYTERDYNMDKQRQALKINLSLRKLYQVLSDNRAENPLSKNINSFSTRYAADFFYSMPQELFDSLSIHNAADVYKSEYATIHKKLMGLLCKHDFRTDFYCGLKAGSQVAEVYKLADDERYFVYVPLHNMFLLCDAGKLSGVDVVNNMSKKQSLVNELSDKNDKLQSRAAALKNNMPANVKTLLAENYHKIEDINFLENMANFDVQANILKTMLNTDLI